MTRYRHQLPQMADRFFLTDGGMETTLVFHEGLHLPEFAAFALLKDAFGTEALRKYFRTYARLAQAFGTGCVLESATWRASLDWGKRLGYTPQAIAELNHKSIDLLRDIRDEFDTPATPIVMSGCIGPRGDGYRPETLMAATEAEGYHTFQTAVLRDAGADLITAMTITYAEEAIGIVRAAHVCEMPVVISFTVETDGCLPTGQSLKAAIAQVDAATDGHASYYMINCAHPLHVVHTIQSGEPWLHRIGGIRPNASIKSHAELDEAEELDEGNPLELRRQCVVLGEKLPNLRVLGGCCGTDQRHVAEIFAGFLQAVPGAARSRAA